MKHSRVVSVTSRMPFIAKNYVRALFLEGRDAALEGDVTLARSNAREIGWLGICHIPAALGGVAFGLVHLYSAHKTGSLANAVQGTYGGVFSAANFMVAYTQLNLAHRLRSMSASGEMPAAALPAEVDQVLAIEPLNLEETQDLTPEPESRYDTAPTRTQRIVTKCAQIAFIGTIFTGAVSVGNLSQ